MLPNLEYGSTAYPYIFQIFSHACGIVSPSEIYLAFNLLTVSEKNYLFKYHMDVYLKISKYLNQNERKWLAKII